MHHYLHMPAANGSFPPSASLPVACVALISPITAVPAHSLLQISVIGHVCHNLPDSWRPMDPSWPATLWLAHIVVLDSRLLSPHEARFQIVHSPLPAHIPLSLPPRSYRVSVFSF